MTSQEALIKLLSFPDEVCLHRGYHYTQTRKGDPDQIKRSLGVAYVERRRHEYGKDISCVISIRHQSLYSLKKRA